ncbi:MAG: cytochrome c [Myxococcota bacterium]|nr:cytochrome c [Myxococcota bacterium]
MFRLLLIPLIGLVGCGDPPEDYCDPGPCDGETGLEETGLDEVVGDIERGAEVFAGTCAGCHGPEGSGGSAPGLMYIVKQHDDSGLTDIILEGTGNMPPQDLSNQELADVIAYLRDSFGEFEEDGHR